MKEKIFKYLKTICLCILITSFIISFVGFISKLESYLKPAKINNNPTDSNIVSEGKKVESELEKLVDDLKDKYGENYPALGIVYHQTILHYSSVSTIQNFLLSLIVGFGIGNIIYFIFIAKYKKYKLFLALLIALLITSLLFSLSDILTNISNNKKIDFSLQNILWNMEVICIPYLIISIILIVANKIYSTYIEIRYS